MRRVSDPSELANLSSDAGIISVVPRTAFVAEREEEVAAAMRDALSLGLPVTLRGGGTSIPSQSVGEGAIVLQRRSRVVLSGERAVCEPAAVKADLNSALAREGRWMPVDPSSYASCTIGGMVANNASGLRTMKYGSTIDYVTGLRAVFVGSEAMELRPLPLEDALGAPGAAGRVASLIAENRKLIGEEQPRVTKNSSGYRLERAVRGETFDLAALLVGSEGTLGGVTEATLRTIRVPGWRALLVAETALSGLADAVASFRELRPAAVELVDKSVYGLTGQEKMVKRFSRTGQQYLVFCELDGEGSDPGEAVERVASSRAAGLDPLLFTSRSDVAEAWEARNGTLALAQGMKKGGKVPVPGVEDLVVPPERLEDLVGLLTDAFAAKGVEYILYGHAGDANLHARPFLDPSAPADRRALDDLMETCFEGVWKMEGSMTGEHGDGMLRAKYVERQYPKTYWVMRAVKEAFDPEGVLNPGVKLPPGRP